MEKHCFRSLDGITSTALEFVFEDMLSRESSRHPIFKHDDYEWHVGGEVFCALMSKARVYNFEFDYETRRFLGIDMIIDTSDVAPRDVCLVKKNTECFNWRPMTLGQKIGKTTDHLDYHYVDTDIVSTINESKRRVQEMDIRRDYDESMLLHNSLNKIYESIKAEEAKTMKIDYTTCHKRNLFTIGTPEIEGVIFHGPCTIVKWSDGDKTIVRCKIEDFDKEKGLAMAICKKMMGTNKTKSNYYDVFKKWLPEEVMVNTIFKNFGGIRHDG